MFANSREGRGVPRRLLPWLSLLVWSAGLVIPLVLHLTSSYSRGETGLIELAALFQLASIIVCAASAVGLLAGIATCIVLPEGRKIATIGIVVNALTFGLCLSTAVESLQGWGRPLGCKQVGPDIQIGPDQTLNSSADSITAMFREPQLKTLHAIVNSSEFRATLAARLCEPLTEPFTVSVRLVQEGECQERLVRSAVTPVPRARCFDDVYRYVVQQQVRKLDPGTLPPDIERLMAWPEPKCNCSESSSGSPTSGR